MWTLLLSRLSQPGVFIDRRQFDNGEIRIGRTADMADWVLADPDRHLSRHHCTVSAVGLDLFVIDTSSNGLALNDASRRVASQQPVPIRVRDRLLLGDYMIEVATEGAGAGVSLQPPPSSLPGMGAAGMGAQGLTQPDAWFDGSADPVWGIGAPNAEVHEFLGNAIHDFLAPAPAAGLGAVADPWAGPMADAFSKPILSPVTPVDSAFAIPEDWAAPAASGKAQGDPFGGQPASGGVDSFGTAPRGHDPLAAVPWRGEAVSRAEHSDDPFAPVSRRNDLFDGLVPPSGADAARHPFAPASPESDPFAGFGPPASANASSPTAAVGDPFAGFAPPSAERTSHDPFAHLPEDAGGGFVPAPSGDDPFAGFAAPSGASPFVDPLHDPFASAPDVADPFDLSTPHRPGSLHGASGPEPFAQPAGSADPFADSLPSPKIDPFADHAPPTTTDPLAGFSVPVEPLGGVGRPATIPAPIEPAAAMPDAAGWAAFCEGAGIAPNEMRGSPEAMRRLGTLYRQVVLGLSDLIQDRAAFKDEFRVERTQLSFGKNNPLKHLPAIESARLLLGDPLPGFMDAEGAVRGAFADVKKHQLAMLAGVQHALTAVFERLAPAEIERIMQKAAAGRKGLPFGRGVNPWTVYQTVFDALRLDAASNVDSVMSVAFRKGYETFLKNTA